MFSGIVNAIGTIDSARQQGDLRVTIACPWKDLAIGESVAVNGACLTVVENTLSGFAAELSAETLSCTAPRWQQGQHVNLERSFKLGEALSGHLVTGHVDGTATIAEIKSSGDSHILAIDAPASLSRFIAPKGSVTLDGVSLTVNQVDKHRFWVNIVPHTWRATTLSEHRPGDALNLEIDMIARYLDRLLQK